MGKTLRVQLWETWNRAPLRVARSNCNWSKIGQGFWEGTRRQLCFYFPLKLYTDLLDTNLGNPTTILITLKK